MKVVVKEALVHAISCFLVVVGAGFCVSALVWMGLSFMRRFFQ